jgi:hypothetical protein
MRLIPNDGASAPLAAHYRTVVRRLTIPACPVRPRLRSGRGRPFLAATHGKEQYQEKEEHKHGLRFAGIVCATEQDGSRRESEDREEDAPAHGKAARRAIAAPISGIVLQSVIAGSLCAGSAGGSGNPAIRTPSNKLLKKAFPELCCMPSSARIPGDGS